MVLKLIWEFLGKGWTVSGLNKLNWKLRNTGSTRRRQGSGRPHSARMMTTLILSMNWFWVRKVGLYQRVTEPHVTFHERQEFITLRYTVSFVRIWSSNAWRSVVRKNSLLQTVRCAEVAHKNCYVVSQHLLWTSYFSLSDELGWKLVDDILKTWSDLLLLCFSFISNWVNANCNVGFCRIMFMPTVAALGVFSAWVTIKYHTPKIWNVCFVANFLCCNISKYFKDWCTTHRIIAKIQRVPVFFWNSVYIRVGGCM